MRFTTSVAVAALTTSAFCSSSLAQEPTPAAFVGAWKLTWAGERQTRRAQLVLKETGGTWRTFEPDLTKTMKNKCRGLEVPVSIESAGSDSVVLKLNYAATLAGCGDSKLMLKRIDDKTIAGKYHGADVTVSRE